MDNKRYLRLYLIFVLFLALLELIDNAADLLDYAIPLFSILLTGLFFAFFFINIIAFLYFRQLNISKLTLILPIYYVLGGIFTLSIGLFLSFKDITTVSILQSLNGFSIVFAVFEILFALYLYRKLL